MNENWSASRLTVPFIIACAIWGTVAAVVLGGCTTRVDVQACVDACKPYPAVISPPGYPSHECQCVYVFPSAR